MYNVIIDKLPLEFKGQKLKAGFKQVLKFFALQIDEDLSKNEKAIIALYCFFKTPVFTQETIDFISWFINGGEIPEKIEKDNSPACFDWNKDINYIYAAFMQVYKIDLTTVNLHWWKFLALYKGLPVGTKISDIIQIRATPIPILTKGNKEYVSNLTKLKKYYALETEIKKVGMQLENIFGAK